MKTNEMIHNERLKKLNKIIVNKNNDFSVFFINPILGKVYFPYGTFGDIRDKNNSKGGYGLEHIIQARYETTEMSSEQITGLCILISEMLETNCIKQIGNGKCILESNDIKIVLSKDFYLETKNWVLTGYPIIDEKNTKIKRGAIDAIEAVNAKYNYLPGYLCFDKQVGTIISSINIIRKKFNEINLLKKNQKHNFVVSNIDYDIDFEHVAEIVSEEKMFYELIAKDYEIDISKINGLPQNEIENILQCEAGELDIYNPDNEVEEEIERAVEIMTAKIKNELPKKIELNITTEDGVDLSDEEAVADTLCNKISDKTGWLINGFDYVKNKENSKEELEEDIEL